MAGFEKAFDDTKAFSLSGFKVRTDDNTAFNETMAILNDVEAFSAILQSMREARSGKLLTFEATFADIL